MLKGRTLEEFAAEDPARAAAYRADPVVNAFPGAEDPRVAAARGTTALRCAGSRTPTRRVFPYMRHAAVSEVRLEAGGGAGGALLSLNVPCL